MDKKRKLVKKFEQFLGAKLLHLVDKEQESIFNIAKHDLVAACRYLTEEHDARLFTMVGSDERPLSEHFALYYVFAFDALHYFITVRIILTEDDPTFPSLCAYLPSLNWYEREVNDLLGLRAQGHPNRAPLVFHTDMPANYYPLRKDFIAQSQIATEENNEAFVEYAGEDITEIPVGPIHAGIIEPGHFRFGAVGDNVLHLDARLFYTHRGIEKALEGQSFAKARFMIERICCVCNVSHSAAFAQALEQAAATVIPARARYLRTLWLELERLYNHIGDVGNICAGFGFAVGASQGARLRQQLLELNEYLSGHRYLRGMIIPGGVTQDLQEKDLKNISNILNNIDVDFQEFVDILLAHDIAIDRMATTGVLKYQQAVDLGVVGVAARASGVDIDCRRDFPYAAYDKLDFAVIVKHKGDVLARIKTRILEAFNTIQLLRQIINDLPAGSIYTELTPIAKYTAAFGWTESARGENCHWLMTGPDQTIYRYRIRSAAYSNWPAVPLTVPGNIVADFPLINKSFELCYSCCDR